MKMKKEYIILGVLIITLSVYLFNRRTDRTLYELPKLFEISGKDISKIEIARPDETMVLTLKDGNWYTGSRAYRVDNSSVTDILSTIEKLTLTALVSESKDYIRYDLNDKKKITVKIWDGDDLKREFDIGKTATSSKLTFIKIAGDDRVFHARNSFRSNFDKSIEEMRDKNVLSFTVADIQEIHITKKNESISFTRSISPLKKDDAAESKDNNPNPVENEIIWQDSNGQLGDESKINNIITSLSALNCKKFINDKKKTDFSKPLYRITLKGPKEYTVSIFSESKEDKDHPAISSESEYPFMLNQWRVKNLVPDFKELVKGAVKS